MASEADGMQHIEDVAGPGERQADYTASPLYKRLVADGYTDEELAADIERWGSKNPGANAELYAVAMRYSKRYGGESADERKEGLVHSRQNGVSSRRRFKQTFETLRLRCDDPTVLLVAEYLEGVAHGEKNTGLMIFGAPGTYKTWMCRALRKEALASGYTAIFYPVKRLITDVQKTYSYKDGTQEQVIRQLLEHRIVGLDDLGRERGTPDAARIVSDVIDALDREQDSHTLIITSNVPPAKLAEAYEPAMISRLRGMCSQVSITLEDQRGMDRENPLEKGAFA